MKRLAAALLKIGLSAAILAWLVGRAMRHDAFADLGQQFRDPGFDWAMLGLAFGSLFVAVLLTFLRWYYLVRALGMPFTFRESLRLGFLGFLFNLAPMGIVGGDLLKAVMLARQQPRARAKSVATVAVDRVIGLYVLFLVASAAILMAGFWQHPDAQVRYISLGTLALTLLGAVVLGMMFLPGRLQRRLTQRLGQLPYVGRPVENLIAAVAMYRSTPGVLAISVVISVGVHVLFTIGIFLITLGIYDGSASQVTLSAEFIVAPLASATGVIPVMMGPLEGVLDYLYVRVFGLAWGQGLVVGLGYRLLSLAIALVGVCYYLGARREVQEVMHASETPPGDGGQPAPDTAALADGDSSDASQQSLPWSKAAARLAVNR